jgi:hypothetical protein
MGLRASIILSQFGVGTPNTVLSWNDLGNPVALGPFAPATNLLDGNYGLVPKPVAGQQSYILSNTGWIANVIGGGSVGGTGVAGRISFWTDTDTISSKNVLLWDNTNDIFKAPTINVGRAVVPAAGMANGDLCYSTNIGELYLRTANQWLSLSAQHEMVLGSGVVDFPITEEHKNWYIETSSASAVTIRFPNTLTSKFSCVIVKGGSGNVNLVADGGVNPQMLGTATVITTLRGSAVVYKSPNNSGNNLWKCYGNLG